MFLSLRQYKVFVEALYCFRLTISVQTNPTPASDCHPANTLFVSLFPLIYAVVGTTSVDPR